MRILIYGAGVQGCELAHVLLRGNHEVALLARGAWAETLKTQGMKIHHSAQFRTTREKVQIISELAPEDIYDLIFVVMQFAQLPDVLPKIAQNASRYVVLVGNNVNAEDAQEMLQEKAEGKKETAFAFFGSAGRREKDYVVSLHAKDGMTIGGLHEPLSPAFRACLEKAAENTGCRYTWEPDMDGWLKCHAAFILPMCFLSYILDGNLKNATSEQLNLALDAAQQADAMLKQLGVALRPDHEEEAYTKGRPRLMLMLKILSKTPLGRLCISDHALHATTEMQAMNRTFAALQQRSGVPMPAWEELCSECGWDFIAAK